MNLPAHNRRVCLGEGCIGLIEPGSMFPFCPRHLAELQTGKRHRGCAGAITFDATMRPHQTSCNNETGHPEERLCASCRVTERREKERAKAAFKESCPHCGQSMARARAPLAVPPRSRSWPPPIRLPSQPSRATFPVLGRPLPTSNPGHVVPRYQPPKDDDD